MATAPRFIFYGGKGGVGKTTCAAARALADADAGRRVLVVSTDPAHSLGDAFDRRLSRRVCRITRRLDGVELDAKQAFARWLGRHRAALAEVLERGTWLDRRDAESLLVLPIPGVDELAGLLELVELSRGRPYDEVVVDTAPTGHALRFIAAPAAVDAVAGLLDALHEPHRIVRDRLARAGRADAADEVIELLARQAADVSERVHDSESTTFAWVTLAERLSIAESEDAIAALARDGIAVGALVLNRILLDGGPCSICGPRRRDEIRLLRAVQRSWSATMRLTVVPAMLQEPRGQPALRMVGAYLSGRRTVPASALRSPRVRSRWTKGGKGRKGGKGCEHGVEAGAAGVVSESPAGPRFSPESIAEAAGARTVFVAGKGGVGKTTVAAALALRLAAARPGESILLLSTDPAHSLADVLDSPIGDRSARIARAPANLFARELDAVRAFRHKRESIETALGQLSGASPAAARLLDLAPPGIDELFGLMALVDARAVHDVIVVDTAPTGHALRLLAMPDEAREWTRALLRLMLKYRDVVRPGPLAEELVGASRSIRTLQTSIRDPDATRFVVVTRAARLPMAETARLLSTLHALKIAPAALVVNARTLRPRDCTRCRATARLERLQMAELRRPRDCAIIQTPLVAPPPRGAPALSRWAQSWTADES